ncbi:MAG: dihydroorotase [Pelagibacteraceae bacterium BACL5 MAG-120820-bin39]|jgi:dihydroorotase|uniref:dihydroorotase n=1 Tax=Candidatus Pelagibacter sp. TaxID=2024849 RepID=UPI0007141721|nr:MAG: dihydroorotase [Pelagibacteraceae bacterium BACL5 MAG-121015-bin10]KRO65098.1 MAG: dihydroorotase [Pelagibacteraceae bacterium BACL5 MAG-120820-bin39]KRO75391.1 MAG: dihydroorotase [Pelagibacteraceae bacterium BACL5 MAG-120813-bin20]MDA1166818.1 dihydroorotase [Pseudomonadota bacterium]
MKKQYFINANIIDPHNSLNELGGLIVSEDGKIEAIGKKVNINNLPTREKPIDLNGKYIFPGIVDMRVFVGEPGYEYKENFRTLSNAALSGGVTSVVTMPNTDPIIDNVSIVDFLKRRGRDKSMINIFPCASLTKNIEGTNMTEFGLLQKKGIIAFTDGIRTIQNTQLMSRIMNSAKDLGSLIMQHAEDLDLSKNGMINSGIIATKLGLAGIPDVAERIIIERDLTLLENIKCRYHISQISSEKSVEVIKQRKEKIKFTCGVSINNLSLNENDIGDFRTFLKLSPPLRTEEDRVSLVNALKDEIIDVIVSDHKPEDEESKRLTFAQAATGASGIETLLSLSLELYHNGSVKLETIIKALTSNPAKILKINKGNLSIGADADFSIVDINKPWIVKKEKLISKSKNTSIENKKLQGKVTSTFVRGKELFRLQ